MIRSITVKCAQQCHPLARAVLNQLGGGAEAVQLAREAGVHGAATGWPGFTYYSDTITFAKRHRQAIARVIGDMADDMGVDPISMVRGFLKSDNYSSKTIAAAMFGGRVDGEESGVGMVLNAMAWCALEEVGRAINDAAENNR
jgi:ubiquinone biosynthesis protein UbiJ